MLKQNVMILWNKILWFLNENSSTISVIQSSHTWIPANLIQAYSQAVAKVCLRDFIRPFLIHVWAFELPMIVGMKQTLTERGLAVIALIGHSVFYHKKNIYICCERSLTKTTNNNIAIKVVSSFVFRSTLCKSN